MESIKLVFELDYSFHQRYKIQVENGMISYQDDVSSNYTPMECLMVISGQRNGNYIAKKKALKKLEDFIYEKLINWKCHYPHIACDVNQEWELSINHNNLKIFTSGCGNEPVEFYDLMKLLNELFPEEKGINEDWIGGVKEKE